MTAGKWRGWGARQILMGLLALGVMSGVGAGERVEWSAEQDHQRMMDQLGIRRLRPGVSSDPASPNPANYEEWRANPYPLWPGPLVDSKIRPVKTRDQWWSVRRPELVELFEREVYGRIPKNVPGVTWRVDAIGNDTIGSTAVTVTRLTGHVDNSAYPEVTVDIPLVLIRPAHPGGPMPVLIMFQFGPAPLPARPVVSASETAPPAAADPVLARTAVISGSVPAPRPAPPPILDMQGSPPPLQQLVEDGWAVALLQPNTIQPDNGAGLSRGIIGLTSHGQPRRPEDWGALRAWAWGASRTFDYLMTQPDLDAKRIGIEGVSRYGKAALVAMAFDMRFSMALVASSGETGTKPQRRYFGETLENQTSPGLYHWVAGNFLKYAAAEASFGTKTAADLPVDAGEMIALCAPRLLFISYGSPDHGDPHWVDQRGSYMAAVQAGKVFRLLGVGDLGVGDDYQNAQLPPIGTGLLAGHLAWRQHAGGHTDAPNIKYFIEWADRMSGRHRPSKNP